MGPTLQQPPSEPPSDRSPVLVAVGALAGAALIFAGSFLKWFDVTGQGEHHEFKGTDSPTGAGVAMFGVLIAIFVAVMLIRARKKGGRAWSITALIFAAFVLVVAAQSALAPEAALPTFAASNVAESLGISETLAQAAIEESFGNGSYQATSGIGAYMALVGSALSVAGAIFGIAWAKRFRRMPLPVSLPAGAVPMPPPPAMPV